MLGFSRTFRHQWNQLFHEAYARVMVKENGQFLELFRSGKGSIEAALINCEEAYLGTPENLHNGNLPESEKNEFRKLLEEMYQSEEGKNIYRKADPFSDKIEDVKRFLDKEEDAEIKIVDIREYMENVTDFAKGFRKNKIVKKRFIKLLIETLLQKIEAENKLKAKNLVDLNLDFSLALKELKDIFEEKYGDLHDGNENKFDEIMKYHFTKAE